VDKRIGYIAGELKRKEDVMADLDKKQVTNRICTAVQIGFAGRGQGADAGDPGADAEAAAGARLELGVEIIGFVKIRFVKI
jgi:hypothetical protein